MKLAPNFHAHCWRQSIGFRGCQNLLAFTLRTNPSFEAARPHRVLAHYLDLLVAGRFKRLMVFMPPRHGKSELVSRRLPAYFLGLHPDNHVIACSYSAGLATRMNRDCQRIMDSPAYQELFPLVRLGSGSRRLQTVRSKDLFEIVARRGSYRSAGVGGGITGMGFDLGIIDDPLKNFQDSQSPTIRDRIDDWYASTFWTRQAPHARILLTMTRWHHDDIAGRLLRRMAESPDADQWTVLTLPAIAEGALHPDDGRRDGEALWPDRYPVSFLDNARGTLGATLFAGMYQQQPVPAGGNRFKEAWFAIRFDDGGTHWLLGDRRYQKSDCMLFVTCDPAASERQTGDCTAIGVWAVTPDDDLLVLEMVRGRFGVEGIVPELLNVCRRWAPGWIGVEASGFQVSIVREARRTPGIPPVRELSHDGKGKLVRATPAIIKAEAGKIWLPREGKWIRAYIDELVRFTGIADREDDQVDVTAYAVWQLSQIGADASDGGGRRDEVESHAALMGLWGRR